MIPRTTWPAEWPQPPHPTDVADLHRQIATLTAENAALARENADLRRHRHVLADQVDALTRVNQSHDRGLARVPTTEPGVGRT